MLSRLILVVLALAGLGGCAVYPATPYYGGYYGGYGGYYSAPSVYVAPARPYYYRPRWGYRGWRHW